MWTEVEGNEIKLYGRIYSGDGQFIVSDLNKFLKKNPKATVRLHTPGGSIFDGNLIYNALITSKSDVHIIIDGLAASMGSILILAGKKISIAENAFIMIHQPSGGVDGNAKDFESAAKLLRSIESNMIKKFVNKTGKDQTEVEQWMDGDNWFDAQEALDAGLIDEIIDPVIANLNIEAYSNYNLQALTSSMKEYDQKPNPQISNKKKEMKLNAKSLQILNLQESANENEINAAIEKMQKDKEKLESDEKNRIESLINSILESAIAKGKFLKQDEATYRSLLMSDFESAKKVIEQMSEKKSIVDALQQQNQSVDDDRKDWTAKDWRMKDTKGLLEIKNSDPERYQKILNKV